MFTQPNNFLFLLGLILNTVIALLYQLSDFLATGVDLHIMVFVDNFSRLELGEIKWI